MELVHNDAKTDVLGRALQIIPFIGSVFNHYFCVSAGVREIHDKIHDKQPYVNWYKYFMTILQTKPGRIQGVNVKQSMKTKCAKMWM